MKYDTYNDTYDTYVIDISHMSTSMSRAQFVDFYLVAYIFNSKST